jgi:mono/diheme cytochrome c family protein
VRPTAFFAAGIAIGFSATAAHSADRFNLPQGPGRDLIDGHCQTCHDLQSVVDSAGIRRGAWDAVLANMDDFGLRISDDQRAQILDYLATYLGPNPPPLEAAPAPVDAGPVDGTQGSPTLALLATRRTERASRENFRRWRATAICS